jgi:hypothetical protein
MVAAAEDVRKKVAAAHTRVLAAAALNEAARAASQLIEVPSPPSTPAPSGSSSSNADDYEATIIANLHVQASGV